MRLVLFELIFIFILSYRAKNHEDSILPHLVLSYHINMHAKHPGYRAHPGHLGYLGNWVSFVSGKLDVLHYLISPHDAAQEAAKLSRVPTCKGIVEEFQFAALAHRKGP